MAEYQECATELWASPQFPDSTTANSEIIVIECRDWCCKTLGSDSTCETQRPIIPLYNQAKTYIRAYGKLRLSILFDSARKRIVSMCIHRARLSRLRMFDLVQPSKDVRGHSLAYDGASKETAELYGMVICAYSASTREFVSSCLNSSNLAHALALVQIDHDYSFARVAIERKIVLFSAQDFDAAFV
jgi:hypothetical protein